MYLIGFGNPGRGDDGLGPALADRLAARGLPGLTVRRDFQLTVDHALRIAGEDRVVFADALMHEAAPFRFEPVLPRPARDLASHSLSPASVLALAATLYDAAPVAHVLGISGTEFGEVKDGLSPAAEANLARAEAFLVDWLTSDGADLRGAAHA